MSLQKQNGLKNLNFSELFPLKKVNHLMEVRNSKTYLINHFETKRY